MEIAALLDIPFQVGVLVVDVMPGGAAMSAGMHRGDVITKANEQAIQSILDLEAVLQSQRSENRIQLEVTKKGKPTLVVVDLPS